MPITKTQNGNAARTNGTPRATPRRQVGARTRDARPHQPQGTSKRSRRAGWRWRAEEKKLLHETENHETQSWTYSDRVAKRNVTELN
jgi:hypothetical protein